ncbi:hypothetical protein P280DRAFT_466697, partial [Massarina eburnea CBS 473.64]
MVWQEQEQEQEQERSKYKYKYIPLLTPALPSLPLILPSIRRYQLTLSSSFSYSIHHHHDNDDDDDDDNEYDGSHKHRGRSSMTLPSSVFVGMDGGVFGDDDDVESGFFGLGMGEGGGEVMGI